jgi:tRNA-specific 2-thiouridylase
MSGGVDSSVAAALLVEAGYDVVGCFMRLGSPGETVGGATLGHKGCCSISDAHDARRVAALLDIPFYALNFADEFEKIIQYFEDEYHAGRTPNPCVRCNDWLKFGRLHTYAEGIDAKWVASGHHARIDRSTGVARLARAADMGKDQSYVLFGAGGIPGIRPRQLDRMMLPIGDMTKDEVRDVAKARDLGVHAKPDSQEICFVPDDDYAGLLERRQPEQFAAGMMIDTDGNELASHDGHQHFTIGQRRRLGVAMGEPRYVVAKNPATNTVTLGIKSDLAAVACAGREASWHVSPCETWTPCAAQIRAHGKALPAKVRSLPDHRLEVSFDTPHEALATGQAVVCYQDDLVLCGGWIDHVERQQ